MVSRKYTDLTDEEKENVAKLIEKHIAAYSKIPIVEATKLETKEDGTLYLKKTYDMNVDCGTEFVQYECHTCRRILDETVEGTIGHIIAKHL